MYQGKNEESINMNNIGFSAIKMPKLSPKKVNSSSSPKKGSYS